MFWPNANDIGNEQLSAFSCHGLNFTDYGRISSSKGKLLAIKRIRFNEFGRTGNKVFPLFCQNKKKCNHFIDASVKTVAVYLCFWPDQNCNCNCEKEKERSREM